MFNSRNWSHVVGTLKEQDNPENRRVTTERKGDKGTFRTWEFRGGTPTADSWISGEGLRPGSRRPAPKGKRHTARLALGWRRAPPGWCWELHLSPFSRFPSGHIMFLTLNPNVSLRADFFCLGLQVASPAGALTLWARSPQSLCVPRAWRPLAVLPCRRYRASGRTLDAVASPPARPLLVHSTPTDQMTAGGVPAQSVWLQTLGSGSAGAEAVGG